MRKNEKGSSLIFALAVISIITMVIAACMAISYSYYNRSIVANSERQAYLTAKSVLTNIVDNITAKDTDYLSLIPEVGESETYSVDDKFPSSDMGNVDSIVFSRNYDSLEINKETKEMDKITISVKVTNGKSEKILNADIMQYKNDNDNWQLREYYEGDISKTSDPYNISKAKEILDLYKKDFGMLNGLSSMTTDDKKNAIQKLHETNIYREAEDKIKAEGGSLNIHDKNVSNDNLRKILYNGYFQKEWPIFDFSTTSINLSGTYYIQPYFVENSFSRYVIFAKYQKENKENDGWYNIKIVFYEGHWYYNSKTPLLVYNLSIKGDDTSAKEEEAWNNVFVPWINDENTIMIQ